MDSKTYIIIPDHHFVYYIVDPLVRMDSYVIRPHRRTRGLLGLLKRSLRAALPGRHPGLWAESILGQEYLEFLKQIKPEDHLIFWAIGNPKDVKIISEETATSKVSVMLWDPLLQICHFHKREMDCYPERMRKIGARVCTFDKEDARKAGLEYVGQVYRYPDPTLTDGNYGDREEDFLKTKGKVFFIGYEKTRGGILDRFAEEMEKEGIPYRYMISAEKSSPQGRYPRLDKCKINYTVAYEDVLRHSVAASCLLDIVQPGQTGMTLRPLEALFLGKKLITNNPAVKAEPFYCKENVYVIDDPERPWENLRDFIETPFKKVDDSIISRYNITEWVETIKNNSSF